MKVHYFTLLNVLTLAETRINKNEESKELFFEELNFIHEMKKLMYKEEKHYFEIKGSNPF